jgi:hypothetical protein
MKKTRAEMLEELAQKEWEAMTKEEKAEYDNDYNFFAYDFFFCMMD